MTEQKALTVAYKGAVSVSGKLLTILLENLCRSM